MYNTFKLTQDRRISLANYCYFEKPTQHPTRKLNEHDFIYFLDGEWIIGQNGQSFHVQAGDVLILGANQNHYGISPCTPKTKTIFFHASSLPTDKFSTLPIKTDKDEFLILTQVNCLQNPNVKELFKKIIRAHLDKMSSVATAYFNTLIFELCELSFISSETQLASKIKGFIISSANVMVKNGDVAKKINVCKKKAEKVFKECYGQTIHEFLIKFKIEQAKQLLLHSPDLKLYEIAFNLGFYDQYHLCRVFKNQTGVSPTQFKKQTSLINLNKP